ncbi:MAG TPA: glycosyltransferase [Bryobacteraceae bacterium]|nr:glycosyltransferase [Bryobacteraceae bacterium]
MKVCAISFVECWRSEDGVWMAAGGFPRQMAGIAGLFDEMDLLMIDGRPRPGGQPLPAKARVVPMRGPTGTDGRRKVSVLLNLAYYSQVMMRHIRSADVVHVPLPGDIPLLGLGFALLARKRLIARYGGSWSATSQTTLMNRVTRSLMRAFAGGANIMLATGSGKDEPAPNMHWIFSTALSESELNSIDPDLNRSPGNPPQLAYCGRLSEEKGIEYLLRALARLNEQGFMPVPRVTLMGAGPDRPRLEALAVQLNVARQVRFTGQLDRQGLTAVLSSADLCVQPSLTEGFSKAWLDAMAHGVPVIASRVGAAATVIGGEGQRGWVVEPGHVDQLAATIRTALTGTADWHQLRRRCRLYAESLTLEKWQLEIGRICSQAWKCRLVGGRLLA